MIKQLIGGKQDEQALGNLFDETIMPNDVVYRVNGAYIIVESGDDAPDGGECLGQANDFFASIWGDEQEA